MSQEVPRMVSSLEHVHIIWTHCNLTKQKIWFQSCLINLEGSLSATKWKDRKDDGFQEEGGGQDMWVAAGIKHAHI